MTATSGLHPEPPDLTDLINTVTDNIGNLVTGLRPIPTPRVWPEPCAECPEQGTDPIRDATVLVCHSRAGTGVTHRDPVCLLHLHEVLAYEQRVPHSRTGLELPAPDVHVLADDVLVDGRTP